MHLRYGDKIHVFYEWHDYESGGMTHEVFPHQEEFQSWLDKKTDGMIEVEAIAFINNITVIVGKQETLQITEVVKAVKVSL